MHINSVIRAQSSSAAKIEANHRPSYDKQHTQGNDRQTDMTQH